MTLSNKPHIQTKAKNIIENILYMISVLIVVVFIRYTTITPFLVHGSSMEPNLFSGELILVNKIGYSNIFGWKVGEPKRGDVVVLRPPNNIKEYYIKRIVAVPGETVEFHHNDIIVYNDEYPDGVKLDESYLGHNNHRTTTSSGQKKKLTIGKREYYVLGDNRTVSTDSRNFGAVNAKNIIGKASLVLYPLDNWGILDSVKYGL